VRVAHEGAAALNILESYPAQFVLLDIGLPGMDGYVVAQTIRERFPHVPRRIYAVTGYGREEDRLLAQTAGFDAHFVKPLDPDQLLAVIGSEYPSGLTMPGNVAK
jgi:CheY-like chemotaxis protein